MGRPAAAIVCLSLVCAPAGAWAEVTLGQSTLPKPVIALTDRIAGCNHWSGEEPYDAERAKEIAAALQSLHCETLDKDRRIIEQRFGRDPEVMKAIHDAEESG